MIRNLCDYGQMIKYTQNALTELESEMWKINGLFPDFEVWKLHNMSEKHIKNTVILC